MWFNRNLEGITWHHLEDPFLPFPQNIYSNPMKSPKWLERFACVFWLKNRRHHSTEILRVCKKKVLDREKVIKITGQILIEIHWTLNVVFYLLQSDDSFAKWITIKVSSAFYSLINNYLSFETNCFSLTHISRLSPGLIMKSD